MRARQVSAEFEMDMPDRRYVLHVLVEGSYESDGEHTEVDTLEMYSVDTFNDDDPIEFKEETEATLEPSFFESVQACAHRKVAEEGRQSYNEDDDRGEPLFI